jgi:hypothetical protein
VGCGLALHLCGEQAAHLGHVVAVLEMIRKQTQRQGLGFGDGLLAGVPVGENFRQLHDLGRPPGSCKVAMVNIRDSPFRDPRPKRASLADGPSSRMVLSLNPCMLGQALSVMNINSGE